MNILSLQEPRGPQQGEPLGGANVPPCMAGKKDGWGGI